MLYEDIPVAQSLKSLADRFFVQVDQMVEFAQRDRNGTLAPIPRFLNHCKRKAPFRPGQPGLDQPVQDIALDFDGDATFDLLACHAHTFSLSRNDERASTIITVLG